MHPHVYILDFTGSIKSNNNKKIFQVLNSARHHDAAISLPSSPRLRPVIPMESDEAFPNTSERERTEPLNTLPQLSSQHPCSLTSAEDRPPPPLAWLPPGAQPARPTRPRSWVRGLAGVPAPALAPLHKKALYPLPGWVNLAFREVQPKCGCPSSTGSVPQKQAPHPIPSGS